jgi:hypothetical protein
VSQPDVRSIRDVTCGEKSCAKPIDLAVVMPGGMSRMPVDPAPDPAGNLAVWLDGDLLCCRVLRKGEEPGPGEKRGMPHWATCTNPERWRRL